MQEGTKKEIDFKSIDARTNYRQKEARLMAASRDGFQYISEHIVKVYRQTRSLRETGKKCGDISTIAVRSVLSKCGETLRKPGGRVWSKITDDDVRYIRSQPYMNNQIFIRIAQELSETATKRMGKPTKISSETIRDVWKKKTHKEVD
jgi:hypothetical protein